MLCLLWCLLGHGLARAEFPVGGGNAQRTGYVDTVGPVETPKLLWERPLGVPGGISDTQPLIDPEGHIYATASPTRGDAWTSDAIPQTVLVSFFPDGRERWRYVHTWDYTHPSFSGNWSQLSGPVISGDTVVIGHRYGVVRGVSRQDGSIRWTRDLSPGTHGITSTPVGDRQGFVYYHCKDIPTIHKIEASTGRTAWTHAFTNGSSGNTSSPTLSHDEKTLYIGRTISKVPNIYAINTDDGSLKWIWNAPAGDAHAFAWTVPVLGDDGTVFVQDEATATLFGLVDLGNGARLRHLLANPGTHAPRFGTILPSGYAGQFVHRESNKPVAYLVKPDGQPGWRTTLEGGVSGGLVSCRNALYLGMDGTGTVWGLDRRTGSVLWRFQAGTASASFSEGITLSRSGVLYAGINGTARHPREAVLIALH